MLLCCKIINYKAFRIELGKSHFAIHGLNKGKEGVDKHRHFLSTVYSFSPAKQAYPCALRCSVPIMGTKSTINAKKGRNLVKNKDHLL